MQSLEKAVGSADGVDGGNGACDHADFFVYLLRQGQGGLKGGVAVVINYSGHLRVFAGAVGTDKGNLGMGPERGNQMAVTTDIENSADLLGKQIVNGGAHQYIALRVIVRGILVAFIKAQVFQKIVVIPHIAQRCNAVYDFRGVKYRQVFRQNSDGAGAAGFQRTSVQIGAVVQLVRNFQNHGGGFRLYNGLVVEHVGYRCNRNAGLLRNLSYGCHIYPSWVTGIISVA